jgi:hypothetical protein
LQHEFAHWFVVAGFACGFDHRSHGDGAAGHECRDLDVGGSPALVATTGGLKLNASGRVTYTRASGNAKVTINKVEFLVYKGVAGTNGYEADPITIQDPTLGAVTDPVPSPTTSYQTVTAEPVKNGSGETIVFPAGTKIKVEVRIKYTVTDSDGVSAAPVTTVTLSKAAIED